MRGIRVDCLDGDDYAISFRGAVVFAVGVTELRARLARMGVKQASSPAGSAGWAEYERRKRVWSDAHCGASRDAYTEAMRGIAEELGL